MSADDLEIRSGGVVAVDTGELRGAAGRLRLLAGDLHEPRRALTRAADALPASGWIALASLGAASQATGAAADDLERLARDLDALADLYEYVELDAAATAALLSGDHAAAQRLRARAHELAFGDPGLARRAAAEEADWVARRDDGLAMIAARFGVVAAFSPVAVYGVVALSGAATGIVAGIGASGRGVVPRDRVLSGPSPAVSVTPTRAAAAAVAPGTLGEVVGRMAMAPDARVRVETYAMPDGTRQYVAYVTGTKGDEPGEPWDNASNLDLYLRDEQSASLAATREALALAGAAPGDRVHLVGHSQGAMVATHLAMDSPYDVATLVTIGSPVQGEVGGGTLSVALRHVDDPVSALAAGGVAGGVGAPGSFVAERVALAPDAPPAEWLLGAHGLDRYTETAGMLDASSDPRMDAVRDRLADLGAATTVTTTDYAAVTLTPGR